MSEARPTPVAVVAQVEPRFGGGKIFTLQTGE